MSDHDCFLPPYVVNDFNPVMTYSQTVDWGLLALNIPKLHSMGLRGEGIKCAIIDTGCDIYHPDLANNIVSYWNAIDGTYDVTDLPGHGTHCAGIIGAEGNEYGTVGVAPKVSLSIYKALGSNTGNILDVVKAIKRAVDDGNDFINMSLGTTKSVKPLEDACKYAQDRGVTVVVSSGNSGKEERLYPTSYDTCISVGSIDSNMMISSFSTYGSFLDVVAPGSRILSTYPDGKYVIMSGTSMAAPFVTGCLILLKQAGIPINYSTIIQCVRDINDPKFDKRSGYGIIDPLYGMSLFSGKAMVANIVSDLFRTKYGMVMNRIGRMEKDLEYIKKNI